MTINERSLSEEITEGFSALEKIRQQQTVIETLKKERDLLFRAHSHEMVRADELQIECDRLYRIIELNGKLK